MSYRIIVDISHNEAVEEFPSFALGEEDYEVEYIDKNEGPIKFEKLEDFDILFIGNIQHAKDSKNYKLSPEELLEIKKFIGEGGGLLLTTGAGGDRDISIKDGSIRVLYKITGVRRYWNGIVQETGTNFLVNRQNLVINEFYAHPITKGITELVFPKCTFFTLAEWDVEDLIYTSEKAEFKYFVDEEIGAVGQVPVCTASEFFSGRCVTLGSSEFLIEDSDFGIDAGDNLKFLENIINWLSFEI